MKLRSSAALLLAATLAPNGFAQASNAAPQPIKFDIVSFKRCETIDLVHKNTIIPPGGDSIGRHCQSVAANFDFAYGAEAPYLLKGEPAWVDTDAYDFLAKVAPEDVPAWQTMNMADKRLMVRAVLADVLHLKLHTETASRPVYNLVVAKGGPKLTESKPDEVASTGTQTVATGNVYWMNGNEAVYTGATMRMPASGLAARLDRNVIDMTGLKGNYDFHVKPIPYLHYDPKSANVETIDFAAIIDGIQNLGLKLEPAKADSTVFVIDHIDRPPDN